MITVIDDKLLDEVCAEAAASPRRRKNRNFHPRDEHPGHRLLNALMADTYIPPHRHLDPNKDETYVVLRGRLGLVEFDDAGAVMRTLKVGAGGAAIGVDVAHGTWHTAVALEDETVFLEAKAGPYLPLTAEEKAPWAPAENSPEAAAYLAKMKVLF
jgi:cupin fold WbuC family metalloprotein